jgi:hypothetical protein
MAGAFLVFAFLKAVPLVPETSSAARQASQTAGIYSERRVVQRLAIGMTFLAAAVGLGAVITYGLPRPLIAPIAAAVAVVAFAAIRAASLHAVDRATTAAPWLVPGVEITAALVAAWPVFPGLSRRHGARSETDKAKHRRTTGRA